MLSLAKIEGKQTQTDSNKLIPGILVGGGGKDDKDEINANKLVKLKVLALKTSALITSTQRDKHSPSDFNNCHQVHRKEEVAEHGA